MLLKQEIYKNSLNKLHSTAPKMEKWDVIVAGWKKLLHILRLLEFTQRLFFHILPVSGHFKNMHLNIKVSFYDFRKKDLAVMVTLLNT